MTVIFGFSDELYTFPPSIIYYLDPSPVRELNFSCIVAVAPGLLREKLSFLQSPPVDGGDNADYDDLMSSEDIP